MVVPLSGEGPPQEDGLAAGFAVAERIRVAVAAAHEGGNGPSCTASLGVAGPVGSDLDDALRRADTALYRAKSPGRNRVEVAGELMVESLRDPSAVWT